MRPVRQAHLLLPAVALLAASVLGFSASAAAVPDRALHGFITVTKSGNGEGRVTSDPEGIDCGNSCSGSFVSNEAVNYKPVSLTATPEPGSVFDGFSGSCSGDSCTIDPVVHLVSYDVGASFSRARPPTFPLTVSTSGSGAITSNPTGISCPSTCSASFATDSTATLTVTPTPGWSFAGWGGACSGAGTCSVVMSEPRSVTATFAPPNTVYPLVVAAAGGSVTSNVPGISCGDACVGSYGAGVEVTLTPSAYPVTWGGACSGGGACVVPMSHARAVTAAIGGARLTRAPLAVGFTGKGAVTGSPGGISCGATCGALYPIGTAITLRAAPADGWAFAGWSGSCQGVVLTCHIAIKAAAAAMASFVTVGTRFSLALTKVGRGTVTSRPAGIDCGGGCAASFAAGSVVTLQAAPRTGSTFVRWSGACRGKKPTCGLPMDGPKAVSATFDRLADPVAPRVTALRSTGARGQTARLRYRMIEAGGRSAEAARVLRGDHLVGSVHGPAHDVSSDVLFYFLPWHVPAALAPGALRFCVTSIDPTGNRSKPSCARLLIT